MRESDMLAGLFLIAIISVALLQLGVNYYMVMAVAIALVISLELREKSRLGELGIRRDNIWRSVKAQLPFTAFAALGLIAYASISGRHIGTPETGFVTYWLVSVPMQEFIFRGYLQAVFRAMMSRIRAVLLASAIFSAVHYFAPIQEFWILMLASFGAGFAWGMAYEKERNLVGPIFSHAILGTLIFLLLN